LGRRIRIVVGEGRTAQQGLLRFVLEGEGFDVARETRTIADLAIAVAEEQPDVVVLDDGIGVVAVSMVHEALPRTKIVLVWPSAVVPIGGDARVEPAKILDDLGPAVRQVSPIGVAAGVTETFERPEWIDRIRKDPATLRDKLGASTTETAERPSVTQLQKRGRRLHPGRRRAAEGAASAAVVALPTRAGAGDVDGSGADPAELDAQAEPSEWNRRLGTLALSGAAAVSALALALALGGGRVPPALRGGSVSLAPDVEFGQEPASIGSFFSGVLGGEGGGGVGIFDGFSDIDVVVNSGGQGPDGKQIGDGDVPSGDFLAPSTGSEEPPVEVPDEEPPVDDGGDDDGGNGGGGNGGGGGGNGGGGGGNGGGLVDGGMPGHSGDNPFGGPPSKLGLTPAHGDGPGKGKPKHAEHATPKHGHDG
jgi:hypothetical protein